MRLVPNLKIHTEPLLHTQTIPTLQRGISPISVGGAPPALFRVHFLILALLKAQQTRTPRPLPILPSLILVACCDKPVRAPGSGGHSRRAHQPKYQRLPAALYT